jgi:outer membrane biogenesis lipoprotein LolB
MKKSIVIFSLVLAIALLFAQCKSCGCAAQPQKAKHKNVWQKH